MNGQKKANTGAWVRSVRGDLSQTQFGRRFGTSQATVSLWERKGVDQDIVDRIRREFTSAPVPPNANGNGKGHGRPRPAERRHRVEHSIAQELGNAFVPLIESAIRDALERMREEVAAIGKGR
jgi:transcriptional regulator with XRE-family HTH domain